jgi:hypothetical protein
MRGFSSVKISFCALLFLAVLSGKASARDELVSIPLILGDYYAWAYIEAFEDRADIYAWSTAGVDALGWTLFLASGDYEGKVAGLFFVNTAGVAKTLYPVATLLWAPEPAVKERAWIALGTHTLTLLSLEFLGKPALSVQSALGPRQDGLGLAYAFNF